MIATFEYDFASCKGNLKSIADVTGGLCTDSDICGILIRTNVIQDPIEITYSFVLTSTLLYMRSIRPHLEVSFRILTLEGVSIPEGVASSMQGRIASLSQALVQWKQVLLVAKCFGENHENAS